ncbi:reverse transcriptase domain-containing protein [Tanacetum coccineum]
MPNNVKNYDGTGDLEDHVKIFQAAAQQNNYVKDPVEIHNIKQRDGETIKDFIERFKVETGRMRGAPECMRISEFMHRVNSPELTKRLNEQVPKTMEDMLISKRHGSERKSDFQGQPREGQGSNRFTPLTRTPKEILAVEVGKFKPPPSMIEELVRAGKLSHLTKEIKQSREQPKVGKKDVPAKEKSMAIYMVQPWHKMTRQKVTQSFARVSEITFPPLATSRGAEGPLVIEAEIGGHMIHRMPRIRKIQAVSSTAHRMLKFLVDRGIVTIRSTILIPAECATVDTSSKKIPKEAEVCHKNFKVALHPNFLDQEVAIGGTLSAKGRMKLCSLLKENLDIFAWQPSDMTRVLRSVAEHRLNIREGYSPVRQKKRGQAPERAKAIQVEVQKLVDAGIMREVYYHDWLSNPVMVKKIVTLSQKLIGKWNPSAVTHLSVSWTFTKAITKSKWQNRMKKKRLSIPPMEYIAIPKCPSASRTLAPHTSSWLRAVEGIFLGYMISPDGIKPCPEKTKAVLRLPSPRTIKEVQSLNGKLASLNRFLSNSAERSLPLFKTLKKCIKKSDFHWTPEAEQAFKQLKQHLSKLPMLVAQKPKEELIVYLFASHGAISAVLMTERGIVQTPVYFVSRALQGPELNYTPMEKLILALIFTAKRLRRYFQAHPITVITDQPIKQIISHPNVAGRLQKWSIMLGEHNNTYRPRTSMKGQILADFLVEKPDEALPDASVVETPQEP